MKNLFKVFRIIALVAVIGFSFAACDNGSTTDDGGNDGGGGDKTIWFYVFEVTSTYSSIEFYSTDKISMPIDLYSELAPVIRSLTVDDIVFSDSTVATLNSNSIQGNATVIGLNHKEHITVLKSGTVTVSIKDKDGYKFVKVSSGKDQITFTK